ncbi:MAG: hypothetical protein ABIK28_19075, partial [Planctomycetota bacterium]
MKIIFALILIASGLSCTSMNSENENAGLSASEANGNTGVTQVVMLGTGTPNAQPDRSGSAIAIVVNDTPYIIDCGP